MTFGSPIHDQQSCAQAKAESYLVRRSYKTPRGLNVQTHIVVCASSMVVENAFHGAEPNTGVQWQRLGAGEPSHQARHRWFHTEAQAAAYMTGFNGTIIHGDFIAEGLSLIGYLDAEAVEQAMRGDA